MLIEAKDLMLYHASYDVVEDIDLDKCRKRNEVMVGKIANDDTMATITIYLADGFGPYGSKEAAETAIRLLKPARLKDQLCFRSQRAVEKINFVEAVEVSL